MDVDPQLEELTELEPPARGEAVAESQAHCSQAVSKKTNQNKKKKQKKHKTFL